MTTTLSAALPPSHTAARSLLNSPFARVRRMAGLVGIVLLLGLQPLSLLSVSGSALLVICGLYAGRALKAAHAESIAAVRREVQVELDRVTEVCSLSAPVWIRQIETVRSEADQE